MSRISGVLPWGSGAGNLFQGLGGSPQQAMAALGPNYQAAYQSSLDQNKANYENILKGYQDTVASQATAQDAIGRGYTDLASRLQQEQAAILGGYGGLKSEVIAGIQGIGTARAADINRQYTNLSGQAAQGLISRGLGNTTVQDSIQRGIAADQAQAQTALANQIAGLEAGYRSSLGQAGLGYRASALGQLQQQQNLGLGFQADAAARNSALAQAQLQWMNSVNAAYPDAGMYGTLAQQFGAQQQAGADRGLLQQQMAQDRALADAAMKGTEGGLGGGGGFGGGVARGVGGLEPPRGNYGGSLPSISGSGGLSMGSAIAPGGGYATAYGTGGGGDYGLWGSGLTYPTTSSDYGLWGSGLTYPTASDGYGLWGSGLDYTGSAVNQQTVDTAGWDSVLWENAY